MKQVMAVTLAMALVMPSFASTSTVEVQNKAALSKIKAKLAAHTATTDDAYEAATRLEVEAARIQDAGIDRKVLALYKANPAKYAKTPAQKQAWAYIERVGTAQALLDVAAYHKSAAAALQYKYAPLPMPVTSGASYGLGTTRAELLSASYFSNDACSGMQQTNAVTAAVGSIMMIIPGAEAAGGVVLMFSAVIQVGIFMMC